MVLRHKVIVVTGGGNGIGRALCRRFAAEGAGTIVVADVNAAAAQHVAGEIRGEAIATDVLDGALEPEQVADAVVKGIADEQFLILPHPEVAEYFRRKAGDYDRWLKGMRRLQKSEG